VAAGYLEDEYRALGADFAHRNAVTDVSLVAMKRAWTGESLDFEGRGFRAAGNRMLPVPVQKPHPPVWVGGNSRRAMRRAVEHAQGWSPFPIPARYSGRTRTDAIESMGDLGAKIAVLRELAAAAGRTEPLDVNFVPFGFGMNTREPLDADAFCEQVEQLEALGVTWLSLGLPFLDRGDYEQIVGRFGEDVIARLRRTRE
jgi:alkanesulfonate monooxygenase SsuD/methylene tetrahydromethanopterin reductase-like flavin-dependent oxidoreductase (luciferase family)